MRLKQRFLMTALLTLSLLMAGSAEAAQMKKVLYASGSWPTDLVFTPKDDRMFVTLRFRGEIRTLNAQKVSKLFYKVNTVQEGEAGVLGLAMHPSFTYQPFIYFYYTYKNASGVMYNRVLRVRDYKGVGIQPKIMVDRIPAGRIHNGGILEFGFDKKLYITTGDAGVASRAQNRNSLAGKVLRINPDGTIPADNPFPIPWYIVCGHRNVFGMAFNPSNYRPYITENGPRENDEINMILRGGNYGWPLYLGDANQPPYRDPVLTINPVTAPTQMLFYRLPASSVPDEPFPASWKGNLVFGEWKTGMIRRAILSVSNSEIASNPEDVFYAGSGVIGLAQNRKGELFFTTSKGIYKLVRAPTATSTKQAPEEDQGGGSASCVMASVGLLTMIAIGYALIEDVPSIKTLLQALSQMKS